MNIAAINLSNFNRINYKNNNFYKNMTFTGLSESKNNVNTQKALACGKNILQEGVEDMSIENMNEFFDVPIVSLNRAKNITTEAACIDYTMFEDGSFHDLKIYVPQLKRKDKIGKTIFTMNLVHEYTHAQQIKNGEDRNEILYKEILEEGFPISTMSYIQPCAFNSFKVLSRDCFKQVIASVLGQEGKESFDSTGGMILTNAVVTNNLIANVLGFPDARTFKESLVPSMRSFDIIARKLCEDCPQLRQKYRFSPDETLNSMKKILINYCKNSAKSEKEAYMSENLLAQSQGFDEKGSKTAYRYFSMLEEALKN